MLRERPGACDPGVVLADEMGKGGAHLIVLHRLFTLSDAGVRRDGSQLALVTTVTDADGFLVSAWKLMVHGDGDIRFIFVVLMNF
ncbi:hypothetical protein D9M68_915420 [compost metagenome]